MGLSRTSLVSKAARSVERAGPNWADFYRVRRAMDVADERFRFR